MTDLPRPQGLKAVIDEPNPLRLGRSRRDKSSLFSASRVLARASSAWVSPKASAVTRPFPPVRYDPAARPLAMPRQDLRESPAAPRLGADPWPRRLALILGAALASGIVGALLLDAFGDRGLSALEATTVVLSVLLAGWIGFGFVSAAAGFVVAWRAPATPEAPPVTSLARTALLLPAYNEDPGLIFSAAQAMAEDLARLNLTARFDIFVLSDTRDEAVARAESAAYLRLKLRLGGAPGLFYRRRAENIDRKAGNVGEWVETHGAAYGYMVVLDADSLLTAETLQTLAAEMDRDPELGLLQTVPTIVNAHTPFARLQQFASRLYGPVFAAGQQWWSGAEGNYWGHNAIIRVAAFADSAGLPHLPGPRPWCGHIMSHDFVEAALLRRRGWAVRTLAALGGSYEEAPPTLLDTAVRDRRWCQGNLQHVRLLGATGLHPISRLHLLMGVLAYLASPLWLLLLIAGAVTWSSEHFARGSRAYFEVGSVFVFNLALLAIPKLLALILALKDGRLRAGFGGAGRLILGVLVETLASLLITPVTMMMQSVAVADVLIGRDSGWKPQRRDGVEISSRDAWRAHRGHVALGVLGALGALFLNRYLLVWAGPVFLSLALSSLLSLHTSRPSGRAVGALPGLLRIPEDSAPPPVLVRARELRAAYAAEADLRPALDVLFREDAPVYEIKARRWAPQSRQAA
jgi:membrane glycosyltransferase